LWEEMDVSSISSDLRPPCQIGDIALKARLNMSLRYTQVLRNDFNLIQTHVLDGRVRKFRINKIFFISLTTGNVTGAFSQVPKI
jgi:hypothetical protein